MSSDGSTRLRLHVTATAAGGDGVARDGGRVVFVRGGLPGDLVHAELTEEKQRFARARVVEVLEPAPGRREPPCPHVAAGCGGCGWQHATDDLQAAMRRAIVTDALERLGGVRAPRVDDGPPLPGTAYRTSVRVGVVDGRAAYRKRSSHDLLAVDSCLVAHPLVEEVLADGRFGSARQVTVRAGARTGERLVLVEPSATRVVVPDGVRVVGADELATGRRAWHHEEVAGHRWRISATSFFQARPDGAEALVTVVRDMVDRHDPGAGTLVDLCAGVGLFAGTVAADRPVVAVERHRPAVADARHNLADREVRLVRAAFEGWRPSPAAVVVADPARSGLGRPGVAAVAGTGAGLAVLVSCDAASLGRDARLLAEAGFRHVGTTVVDMFPQTPHVEAVTAFVRGAVP